MDQPVDRNAKNVNRNRLMRIGEQVRSNRSPARNQRDLQMLELLIKKERKNVQRANRTDLKNLLKSQDKKPDQFESGETAMNPSLTRVQLTHEFEVTPVRPLARSPGTKKLVADLEGTGTTKRNSAIRQLNLISSGISSGINEPRRLTGEFPTTTIREFDGLKITNKYQNHVKPRMGKPQMPIIQNRTHSANSICLGTSQTKKLKAAMDGAAFDTFLRQNQKIPKNLCAKKSPSRNSPKKADFSTINYDSTEHRSDVNHRGHTAHKFPQPQFSSRQIQTSAGKIVHVSSNIQMPQPTEFELLSDVFGSKTLMFKTEFYNSMTTEVKKKLGLIQSPLSKTRRSVSCARRAIDKYF